MHYSDSSTESITADTPYGFGDAPKKVRFTSGPPVVLSFPAVEGTWAFERPLEGPSTEAQAWSARQMHDTISGQVHKYEPHAHILELKEIQEDTWAGKLIYTSGFEDEERRCHNQTFDDILGKESALSIHKDQREHVPECANRVQADLVAPGSRQPSSFNAMLGLGNQATNTRLPPLSMTGPRLGRMISNDTLDPGPAKEINRPPRRVPTRKPLPKHVINRHGRSISDPYVPVPEDRPVTLQRHTTDFCQFLTPDRVSTWDVDDADRKSVSSLSSVVSVMNRARKLGKRALNMIDEKLEQRRREQYEVRAARHADYHGV